MKRIYLLPMLVVCSCGSVNSDNGSISIPCSSGSDLLGDASGRSWIGLCDTGGSVSSYHVYVDPNCITDGVLQNIVSTEQDWNSAVGVEFTTSFTDPCPLSGTYNICISMGSYQYSGATTWPNPTTHSSKISVNLAGSLNNSTLWNTNELTGIIMHEFEHAFGLQHSTDPDNLIYPTISHNLNITINDINQYFSLHSCSLNDAGLQ